MNKLSNEEFVSELRRKLETADPSKLKHSIEETLAIVEKQHTDIDRVLKSKGWRYMKNLYLKDYTLDKIFFYKSGMGYNCMCLQTDQPDIYKVTFTFIHELDLDNQDNDYKKYCIYNYVKGKYTWDVKASSFLNAIASAANNAICSKYFPKRYRYKVIPELCWCDGCGCEMPKATKEKPEYFNDCYHRYKEVYNKLLNDGYTQADIRYYMFDYDFGILVLKKDNTYKVVFSFVNPEDYDHIVSLKNKGDYKHISRYCLIQNYLNNKYCYDCTNMRNSISAAYYTFNDNVKKFPGRFKKSRLSIQLNHYVEKD